MNGQPSATLSNATQHQVAQVLAFIAQDGCDDDAFNAMARSLFAHQHEHNEPLRRFCQHRGITPRRIDQWRDIPAVPINAFKEVTLSCEPVAACERVFITSGTTRAEQRGQLPGRKVQRHIVESDKVAETLVDVLYLNAHFTLPRESGATATRQKS